MPTVMSHAVVGVGLGILFTRRRMPLAWWLTTIGLTMLPDLDIIAFRFGIPYEAPLGHRGFSHSLLFALLLAIPVSLIWQRYLHGSWRDLCGFFFLVAASHGLLDALTDGGKGIAFFWPFDNTRYFFPLNPIRVSPIGPGFFSARGWETVQSEMLWIWLPTVAVVVPVLAYRHWVPPTSPPDPEGR